MNKQEERNNKSEAGIRGLAFIRLYLNDTQSR